MDAQTRYEKRAYFSGKRFVPLIFHLFSIEGGARHPWQLSAIATAIATWLGALSRSHGTRAHHKGGANSGEVQKTAQGERKGCTRTWKTNAPRAHRVVHRAHRAYISLSGGRWPSVVTDSNRPQPLWQPSPTACLTTSEAPALLMHPCPWGQRGAAARPVQQPPPNNFIVSPYDMTMDQRAAAGGSQRVLQRRNKKITVSNCVALYTGCRSTAVSDRVLLRGGGGGAGTQKSKSFVHQKQPKSILLPSESPPRRESIPSNTHPK